MRTGVIKFILMFIVLSSFKTAYVQTRSLSLEECLAIADRNNPELKQVELAVANSEERKHEIQAAYYPQINFNSEFIQRNEAQYLRFESVQGQDVTVKAGNDKLMVAQLDVNQLLYDFGETSHSVKAEGYEKQAQAENKKDKRLIIYNRIKQQFYLSISNIRIDRIYIENVKRSEILKQIAAKRVEAGAAIETDVLRAEVNLQNAKVRQIAARNAWQKSLSELIPLLGLEESDFTTRGKIPLISKQKNIFQSTDKAVEKALKNRHDLKQTHLLKKKQDELTASVRSSLWPKIYMNGNIAYNAPNLENKYWNDSDLGLKTYNGAVSLKIELPLFTGGRTTSQINQNSIQSQIITERVRDLELQIKKQVRIAFQNLSDLWATLESVQSSSISAAKNLDRMKINYENGAASSLEYTDALNSMAAAEVFTVRSELNILQTVFNLERIIGSETGLLGGGIK